MSEFLTLNKVIDDEHAGIRLNLFQQEQHQNRLKLKSYPNPSHPEALEIRRKIRETRKGIAGLRGLNTYFKGEK